MLGRHWLLTQMKLGDRKFVDLGYQRPELLFATLPCNQLSVSRVIVDSGKRTEKSRFPRIPSTESAYFGNSW